MINFEYIKNYLISNKIIFPTNQYDNNMSGFQNYGPIGFKMKNNIIEQWRKIFFEDNIYEIDAPTISSEKVLSRSGHIQKFNDLGLVYFDKTTNQIKKVLRVDHLIEDKIAELKLDIQYTEDKYFITNFIEKYNLYDKGNEYFELKPMSLMFKMDNLTEQLYLRPELAQTMFIEFKQFYNYNNNKLPFGIAQVGKSYRNEISDKAFTRLREFTQAEIEYFYNPFQENTFVIPDKDLSKKCLILSNIMQENNEEQKEITLLQLSEYVNNPIILGYIYKLYLFAQSIGLNMSKVRFRQHKTTEKAHYAKDCWDLEADIFGKWLEISGLADRGDYDLSTHNRNNEFYVKKSEDKIKKYNVKPNIKKILELYDKETAIKKINECKSFLETTNFRIEDLSKDHYLIEEYYDYEYIIPHVIEPSLGIDRIFYTMICHNLFLREDGKRPYLVIPKRIQTYDFALAQLSNNKSLLDKLNEYSLMLNKYKIYYDYSNTSIGKRYTRTDELGIQYTITIDFDTLKDDTITIRNCKDMSQIRCSIKSIDEYLFSFI
jgi:glycyl-tRNA synthetase